MRSPSTIRRLLLSAALLTVSPFLLHAATPDHVVAKVNGSAIKSSQVDHDLPADATGERRDDLRHERLRRLVETTLVEQALHSRGESVLPAEVDREYKELEQSPPVMSCGCHSFPTLKDYLSANDMTEDDLRLEIRRNQALDKIIDDAWRHLHPTADNEKQIVRENAQTLRQKYRKVWQIVANAALVVPATDASQKEETAAKARLDDAQQQLKKGKAFEEVARVLSQDPGSAFRGGLMGYMPTDQPLLGLVDQRRWPALQGVVGPYRSYLGYHLIRVEPLTDSDVLEVLKKQFALDEGDRIWKDICTKAKVWPDDLNPAHAFSTTEPSAPRANAGS